MATQSFTVRVPASTSNLGSGFDTVSAALGLYLTLRIEPGQDESVEWVQGESPDSVFPAENNLVARSLESAFELMGSRPPALRVHMHNPIPLERGLGSSAAAIVGGVKMAERLAGQSLDRSQVFEVGYPLEGHPDNLAASLLGGWVLSRMDGERILAERIDSPLSCHFVLAVPELSVSTREARAILPGNFPREDVTYNLQRCALLVHALHAGDKRLLGEATSDRLHQPFRAQLVPGIAELLRRDRLSPELSDELLAISISGSGSTVVGLAEGRCEEIGQWMVETLALQGTSASYRILELDTRGAQVTS